MDYPRLTEVAEQKIKDWLDAYARTPQNLEAWLNEVEEYRNSGDGERVVLELRAVESKTNRTETLELTTIDFEQQEKKMGHYAIEITETLQKIIAVEAESEEAAWAAVNEMYKNGDITLSADDFTHSGIDNFDMTQEQAKELYLQQNPPELNNEEIEFSM